jgi:predicted Fe-Mo cluster-binding NifX family protein
MFETGSIGSTGMKVAVATIDGVSVSQHFGRSTGFVVFEVEGTTIAGRELKTNDRTPHAQGLCTGHHEDGAAHEHAGHSHAGVVDLLAGCSVVLCGGMGGGAAYALSQHGIQPVIVSGACSAEEALSQYLKGAATPASSGFCNCGH